MDIIQLDVYINHKEGLNEKKQESPEAAYCKNDVNTIEIAFLRKKIEKYSEMIEELQEIYENLSDSIHRMGEICQNEETSIIFQEHRIMTMTNLTMRASAISNTINILLEKQNDLAYQMKTKEGL